MSFREKSAWITFILLLVVFGFYFVSFGVMYFAKVQGHHVNWFPLQTGAPDTSFLLIVTYVMFALLLVPFVVMETVLHIIIAVRSPADAK